MKRRHGYVAFLGCIALLTMHGACAPEESTLNDPDTLAVYKGGSISVQDLDEAILKLSPAQRQIAPGEAVERNQAMVRRLAVNRLLAEQAEASGVDQNQGLLELHMEKRQKVVADFLIQSRSASLPQVSPDGVRRYYEEHRDLFGQPERRLTSHIYRRVGDGVDRDTAASELGELRERVLRGESFGALAERTSDSETAHGKGELGWLTRDSISSDLAEVIFSLDLNVPSEPVVTGDGVHLFVVTTISTARDYAFSDVEGQIVGALRNEQRLGIVSTLMEELPLPEPAFVPESEELRLLLGAGDPHAAVFQIGESTVTVQRFRQLMERSLGAQDGSPTIDLAEVMLRALVQRARIYEYCRSEGMLDEPGLRSRLENIHQEDLLAFITEQALTQEARRDAEVLEAYYRTNRGRFSSPLCLDVNALVLPLPEDGAEAIMTRLSLVGEDTVGDRLERVAAERGGHVEHMEKVTVGHFRRWSSRAARIVSTMEVSECSQPIRIGQTIVVLEVTNRWEPEPLPYSEVSDQVARAYVADHRQVLFEKVTQRILDEAGYESNQDNLEFFSRGDFS